MREEIAFDAGGVTLRGRLYRPAAANPPVIVMSHGLSAIIAMGLARYAEAFVAAGFAALLYDHRNFGLSDGEPRQEADPWQQVSDMRDAITFARTLDGIDPARIGVWGTSYSGGHAIVVGALDRRIKCVVAQAPLISGYRTMNRWMSAADAARLGERFITDREARARGDAPKLTTVIAEGTEEAAWVAATDQEGAFVNALTLRSRELMLAYEPISFIARVAPTPVLMILAARDTVTPTDDQLEAYAAAREPKRLALLDCRHFDVYTSHADAAATLARDWFAAHLIGSESG